MKEGKEKTKEDGRDVIVIVMKENKVITMNNNAVPKTNKDKVVRHTELQLSSKVKSNVDNDKRVLKNV